MRSRWSDREDVQKNDPAIQSLARGHTVGGNPLRSSLMTVRTLGGRRCKRPELRTIPSWSFPTTESRPTRRSYAREACFAPCLVKNRLSLVSPSFSKIRLYRSNYEDTFLNLTYTNGSAEPESSVARSEAACPRRRAGCEARRPLGALWLGPGRRGPGGSSGNRRRAPQNTTGRTAW
jgi:hypothetical protein